MCVSALNLLQNDYQNAGFAHKVRAFLGSDDILAHPHNKGLFELQDVVLRLGVELGVF